MLYRWQAAMGAVSGALVAEALANQSPLWGGYGDQMLAAAERLLSGSPVDIDLKPTHSIATAIGVAGTGTPLLLDQTTAALIDIVNTGLGSPVPIGSTDPLLAKALDAAQQHPFEDAVRAAGGDIDLAMLTGMFVGLYGGLGAVPARLVSQVRNAEDTRGRRYIANLVNRLLGIEKPNWYDPRQRRGPKEVLPGLWVSNLYGHSQFVADHPDGLVLSLCNEEGRLAGHPNHITFHLEDAPKTDANPSVELVVDEVLREIAAARQAGRPVLLHCRHGASRTGLILRLILVEELDVSASDALTEAQCLWPHTSSWNMAWNDLVERRAQTVGATAVS